MRDVYVLAVAQALSSSGLMTIVLLGGIVGSTLAPTPGLATLPLSLMIVGLAAATVPAALVMQRFGRRPAFVASVLTAALAALAIAWAIAHQSFVVLNASAIVFGANQAFQQQQRFAAAESVPPDRASKAISTVMLGTLAAAAIGPQLPLAARQLWPAHDYAGSFVVVAALCVAAAAVLSFYRGPPPRDAHAAGTARPLSQIVVQPDYRMAVLASVTAYAVMSFIMTATPISMRVHDGHTDMHTAWVIQSHLLAMYAPSLVTGTLIARIGVRTAIVAGLALFAACVAVDGVGRSLAHYWAGLVLLGFGWNLLFVAGSSLLTTTYGPAERYRAQAVNEFSVFGSQALASLLAGPALHTLGWAQLNLAAVPLLAPLAVALLGWPRGQRSRNSPT
jgi:MFS family permease